MATTRGLNRLSVREVQTANEGSRSDGGGLYLRVIDDSAKWVLRYTSPSGNRREMGLGVVARTNATSAGQSLRNARDLAQAARTKIQRGIDPIEDRDRARKEAFAAEADRKTQAQRESLTLARACRAYHERVIEPKRTTKHAREWIACLENHMPAVLWNSPVEEIDPPALLDFVLELQAKVPETAMRLRQRLETVFD
ncbi:MAG: integrase arm-type DNA-binding domain-containing protein, partial [Burkholderiales bacterium]